MAPGGRRSFGVDSRVARIVVPIAFALLVLAVWQAYVAISGVAESSLPSPTEIARAGWDQRQLLLDNTWVTIAEILIGFAAAIVLGVLLAILVRSSKVVERAIYPWLVVSQMVPIVAIAPIFVLWTGFDLRPKVMVIALVAFFPIVVNTIDGLRAVDPQLLRLMRTLGASPRQRLRYAQIPAALPFLFSGLKVAAALSVIGAVFAEWVGSSEGLGYLILVLNNATETATMFATIFLLAAIGIALFGLVMLAERLLLPWYYAER
jgi:ABC-type nitrate/sulfonate/bicarbonate transport system permease component